MGPITKVQVNKINTLRGHRDCIYTIERSATANVFFSGSGDGLVAMWDLKDPENGQLVANVGASVYALHFFERENALLVGHNFSGIHVIDLDTKKEKGSLQFTGSAIFDLATHGDIILIGTGDGVISVVDYRKLNVVHRIRASAKSARSIAVHPENNEFAVGFSDHTIKVFSLDDYQLKNEIPAHKNSVFTVRYSPDRKRLISGSRDARLKIWNAEENYELEESVVAHMYTINNIDYRPDGKYFVTGSMDKTIKVWDATQYRLLKVIDKARHAGHGSSVNKLYWTDFENKLVSCSDDRTISIWDLKFKENV